MSTESLSTAARARVTGPLSQQIFSALLWALAEPGTIRRLPSGVLQPDLPAACWPALALADVDVTVNVDDDPTHPLGRLIADATGASIADLRAAWLAVLTRPTPAQLARVADGDALHPERGARLTLAVDALDLVDPVRTTGPVADDPAVLLRLHGPGIAGRVDLRVAGLPAEVAARLGRSSGPFPAGFDTWLVTPEGAVAGLPRSTSIEVRS